MPAVVRFDGEQLRASLGALTSWQRVAFAVSCVEVLVPSYARFSEIEEVGDPELVRTVVDAVWSSLGTSDGFSMPPDLPSPDAVKELLPTEDDWNEWAPQAEDAIAALVYLLELIRSDDVEMAAYTSERAYAAVDEFTAREQELEVLDASDRESLLESASIQTELQRQATTLDILRNRGADSSAIAELRVLAQRAPIGGPIEGD
nr:DUF416 family protein [Krasilnikovia cinnamomea]